MCDPQQCNAAAWSGVELGYHPPEVFGRFGAEGGEAGEGSGGSRRLRDVAKAVENSPVFRMARSLLGGGPGAAAEREGGAGSLTAGDA